MRVRYMILIYEKGKIKSKIGGISYQEAKEKKADLKASGINFKIEREK